MKRFSLIILVFFYSNNSIAQCVPFKDEHLSSSYRISEIVVNVENIFNPSLEGENSRFHQYANKLHIKTKKNIVKRDLLFKEGDEIQSRVLAETERLLRSKSYLKDAIVKPIAMCNDGIVVKVTTTDNWSLQPGVSFGTSGGKSKYSFELQEKNLFGFGKSLEVKYKRGIERNEKSIRYNDPNLFGTTKKLEISYQNNSDGNRQYIELIKPFISLNSKSFWEIDYMNWDLVKPIYDQGEIVEEFGQLIKFNELKFGRLIHKQDNNYHRVYLGITTDENIFNNSDSYPNIGLPVDRDYQFPWIGYEYISEDYIKKSNLKTMGRTEDVSLGHYFNSKIGNDFTNNSIHFEFDYSKGYLLNDTNLINLKASINGIYDNKESQNTHFILNTNWHHFISHNKTFYLSGNFDIGENLFEDQRIYLGGETGLRGYPFRYFRGDKMFLVTAEQRFFHNWYPLKTFKFASVVFIDSGSVWNPGEKKELFTNIGIGFRLIPTRTSGGQVIHFDLATPINGSSNLENLQFQIKAKKSF